MEPVLEHTPADSKTNIAKITAIYIVGPSSTGKTTLCNAIAQRFNIRAPAYITEVARTVMKEEGFSRKDVNRIEMQGSIMRAQLRADIVARDAVTRGGFPFLLSDRSAIDPVVYASQISIQNADTLMATPEFQDNLPNYRNSTFILLKPVDEWLEDDGVRSLDDLAVCTEAFQNILNSLEISYQKLDRSCRLLEERVAQVLTYADVQFHNAA